LLVFDHPSDISVVTVSSIVDTASYLMPPQSLEVWGGDEPTRLKLLKRITPVQPPKPARPSKPGQPAKVQPAYLKLYDLAFKMVTVRYLKLVANPVPKLPKWHSGKGQRGWFFADEIILN